ncbi:hypothetical protein QWY85_04080 [Neolewinella lacunae]|uniref:Uncharacterized protein n=1 Tax=Neolewinella lacunae TaxID=1517758 RepID=A0A923PQT5_9BACT|nr:hypothetical protein [Neolewinella lacunae]MBC6996845.1 hypothetical protein [Neolewinella lacunae]MDN3633823.1 hypothetical protein [Neolewinella lacunae]
MTQPAKVAVPVSEYRLPVVSPEEISSGWQHPEPADYLAALARSFGAGVRQFTQIGQEAEAEVTTGGPNALLARYVLYDWMDSAKHYLLLLRDVYFEGQKALVLLEESELPAEAFATLKAQGREIVEAASQQLSEALDGALRHPEALRSPGAAWKFQASPWPVYLAQFAVLEEQVAAITRQGSDLRQVGQQFGGIRALFSSTFGNYERYLAEMAEELHAGLTALPADEAQGSVAPLVKLLAAFVAREPEPNTATEFLEQLEVLTGSLPELRQLIVGTEAGLLLRRELSLPRATLAWLEAELISEVQDFFAHRNQLQNRLQVALRTSENRLEFDRQEGRDLARREIPQALGQLQRGMEKTREELLALSASVSTAIERELRASNAYRDNFLQLDVRQTLQQYARYQRSGWQQIQHWLLERVQKITELGQERIREGQLSISERVVRVVRNRSLQPAAAHYTNMFVTQGYLGESFLVGRDAELQRMRRIIDNWQLGYRGAVLISGKRLSGKSFFGELIGHKFFNNRYVTLAPATRVELAGRFLEPTHSLKEALDFVVKNSHQQPLMVWIDDLGRWWSEEHALAENILNLLKTVDYYSDRLFFVVAANSCLYAMLEQQYQVNRYFQATLFLDQMPAEAIQQAITIRHGATQMQLTSDEGEPILPDAFPGLLRPIYRACKGRIGDALRHWAYAIRFHETYGLTFEPNTSYGLPDELSEDAGILLRMILLDRSTNEFYLRRQFGPAFRDRFQPQVQRFLHLGILLRLPDGTLEINPAIVCDIERALETKHFIPRAADANNSAV